jgi:hypothetical protein
MKTAALLFASLLYILSPGNAQAQCTIQTWVSYSVSDSVALNAAGTDIITSVLLDGRAGMQMIASGNCPDSIISQFNANKQYIQHWPSVQNQIGSVGGWTQGPATCAECYISYQTNTDSGPLNQGQETTFTWEGQTYCGMAGIVFFSSENLLAAEIAYTRSLNTGILVGTATINGQQVKGWRILPYCTPPTSPPDWNPNLYYAPATLPYTAVYFVDGISACVRINFTGSPWFCTPGVSIGWPQSFNLFPANCTHNP